MKIPALFAALLLPVFLSAQRPASKHSHPAHASAYADIDDRALQLPDSDTHTVETMAAWISANFHTPTEKARAIYIWIAYNIDYDVINMFAINLAEDTGSRISRVLGTRKGICENYAALFTAVCNAAGVKSVMVEGYTKQAGFTDYIPHAWSAAQLDGAWYLFDPTWGSGYVDNGRFVRKIKEAYFKATPETFITTHMPFDYLWEFLYYPVTTEDFYNGKTLQVPAGERFDFPETLLAYEKMSQIERETAAIGRILKNGVRNAGAFNMITFLRTDVENYNRKAEADRQNVMIDAYNNALGIFNNAIRQFNVFINYRNDQFKPERPDGEIRQMLDSANNQLHAAKAVTDSIQPTPADGRVVKPLQQLKESIADLASRITQQQDWLAKYLSKSKAARKSMFYKYIWSGGHSN